MRAFLKNKFFIFLVKLLIVVAAFYFIYDRLARNEQLDWEKFRQLFDRKKSFFGVLFILLLSVANRFLEILKWQNLVSYINSISIGEATKQVLGALTAGIFTPNGLGEYAGKAMYFNKKQTKKIIFLNLICNGIQMILTILFGILGLAIIGYWKWSIVILTIAFFLFIIFYFSTRKS